jgi:hypothetical protein
MLISIALLGFGEVGKRVYEKLKRDDGFGIDFRVHVVQVTDVTKHNPATINSNGWMVVNDENSEDQIKRVTIGDDLEWLLQSEGHDTVIDCTSYSEESKDLVMALLRRGYLLHTCSKELVSKHWEELLDICNETPRARIIFNSIPASKTMKKFDDVDLTNYNFQLYKDKDLYSYREADADITAEYIVRDIFDQLKRRRLGNEYVELGSRFTKYNGTYLKRLFGGNFLAANYQPLGEADPINKYKINSNGYRSKEFSKDDKIVAAGCSFTFGSGVPESAVWPNFLGEKLNTAIPIVASPGASVSFVVEELFSYFNTYGTPETVLCLFPNPERFDVPCDNKLVTGLEVSQPKVLVVNASNSTVLASKYLKRPYNAENITTEDMGIYRSIKSIRALEQYCSAANVNLIWGTWNEKFNKLLLELNAINDFKFKYYFDVINSGCYSYKKTNPDAGTEVFYDYKKYDTCIYNHKKIKCDCSSGCHQELLEKYGPEQFHFGLDHQVVGIDNSHPGAHLHAHYAEAFLSKIKKLAPRD